MSKTYPETAALILEARGVPPHKVSQEKAARLIGCSRLQWINWEQGKHRPGEHYAQRLVEVFGVDAAKLAQADGAGDLDQDALTAPLFRAIRDLVDYQVDARLRDKEYV